MDVEYFIVDDGRPKGPFKFDELKELQISPFTFVKSIGMDDYKEAHEIPEICALFGFHHTVTQPQYFASLDVRLLATAIDYLLLTLIYALFSLVGAGLVTDQIFQVAISVSSLVLIPVSKFMYSIYMESSYWQGTLGKSWLGIKVCDEHGRRLKLQQASIRNFAKILSSLTLGVGYLMGFFNKRQQCLHDKIAKTLVVKERLID